VAVACEQAAWWSRHFRKNAAVGLEMPLPARVPQRGYLRADNYRTYANGRSGSVAARGDSERVHDKAHKFTVGVLSGEKLDQALFGDGLPIRDEGAVRLRVWAPVTMAGRYDTDHLDAAFALRERGVHVVMITADTGLSARAKTGGITVFRPDEEKWRLKPELSPRERELDFRLKRADLQRPPRLHLSARLTVVANVRAADIWLENDAALPPEEPPGVRSRFHEFRVAPQSGLSVMSVWANSGVVVLPTMIAPARRSARTM
jgi:hypothetical protein